MATVSEDSNSSDKINHVKNILKALLDELNEDERRQAVEEVSKMLKDMVDLTLPRMP